jgi:hypothetical protein
MLRNNFTGGPMGTATGGTAPYFSNLFRNNTTMNAPSYRPATTPPLVVPARNPYWGSTKAGVPPLADPGTFMQAWTAINQPR